MKKYLSLVIVFLTILMLTACGKNTKEFKKPENYSSVLIVTINPQFKLYLDEVGTVLAVEPVNDDAKEINDDIDFEGQNYEKVVEKIVTTANDKGFVKEDARINLEVVEAKEEIKKDEIINKANAVVSTTTKELNVDVTVTNEKTTIVENNNNNTNNNETTNEENKEESNEDNKVEEHVHSFSEATCTKAATCECGETEGTALGHNYKNGKCTRCGAVDPNFSYTSVAKKNGAWTFTFATKENYYSAKITLYNNANTLGYSMGMSYDIAYADDPELKDQLIAQCAEMQECVKYNNNYYWKAAGGGDDLTVSENKNTVTLTDSAGNKLVLTRTSEKKMKVKTSPTEFGGLGKIPTGTVLTFK